MSDHGESATYPSLAALRAAHEVEDDGALHDDDVTSIAVEQGWHAGDGNAAIEFPSAISAEEACQEYVATGDWGPRSETTWIHVHAWRHAVVTLRDGSTIELRADLESHDVELEPVEPECSGDDGHAWQSPHELLGGLEENPGVFGHGGGVVISEVCAHCGTYRVTDTWAQGPGGTQGLRSVEYCEPDEDSLAWLAEHSEACPL